MEDMTGWCASPRGCGPRTDVVDTPAVVESVAPVVPGAVETVVTEVPAPAVENVHIDSTGVAPVVQEFTDTTVDNAIESLMSSLVANGVKFLIIAVLIFGAYKLVRHLIRITAVRAQEFATAQKQEAIHQAREHEKVKTALATKEKIERARKRRASDAARSVAAQHDSVISPLTDNVSRFDLHQLTTKMGDVMEGKSSSVFTEGSKLDSAFSDYTRGLSLSSYTTGDSSFGNTEKQNATNGTINSPEKRSDNPFSQYL